MPSSKTFGFTLNRIAALALVLVLFPFASTSKDAPPQAVLVRHREGLVHGFLILRSQQNEILADGELVQNNSGDHVTSRLFFHFKDGSVSDETTVFSQRRSFSFISNHLIQKGPSFKHPMDVLIDAAKSQVTVRSTDDHGKEDVKSEHIDVPPDLANGLAIVFLKNLPPDAQHATFHYLAATPKPRLVKLEVSLLGEDIFAISDLSRKVAHYVVKVDIGGIAGAVAPIVGKQPPDTHLWILRGSAPAWLRSEGPLADEGPIWHVELVSPSGPKESAKAENKSSEEKKSGEKKENDKGSDNKTPSNKPQEDKKPDAKP